MINFKNDAREPNFRTYFTQKCHDQTFLVELFKNECMKWVCGVQRELDEFRASLGPNSRVSAPEKYSIDPLSDDFPSYHDWPVQLCQKYDSHLRMLAKKTSDMAATGQIKHCGDVTLYLECQDGNHYFSTPYFNFGSIEHAELDDDNDITFDHIDTAVYAYFNDWTDWNEQHGEAHRIKNKIAMLEAMRADSSPLTDKPAESHRGCEHEDLGSMGYTHGDVVKCPYCGAQAEVW